MQTAESYHCNCFVEGKEAVRILSFVKGTCEIQVDYFNIENNNVNNHQ